VRPYCSCSCSGALVNVDGFTSPRISSAINRSHGFATVLVQCPYSCLYTPSNGQPETLQHVQSGRTLRRPNTGIASSNSLTDVCPRFSVFCDGCLTKDLEIVGFEVLTVVSMKMAVFWVVAPCSLVEVYQRFRGICCLHHQGDEPWWWRQQGPLKRW
jgi:hypothetical protein